MGTQLRSSGQSRRRYAAWLLLLGFLGSWGTLRTDLFPNLASAPSLSSAARQAIPLALIAIVATILALVRRVPRPRGRRLWACILLGLGLFLLPQLVQVLPQSPAPLTIAAIFATVSVFATVLEPYLGAGEIPMSSTALLASIVASGGAFLIFPVAFPATGPAAVAFLATATAALGLAAAYCIGARALQHQSRETTSLVPAVAIASSAGALALAAFSAFGEHRPWNTSWPKLALSLVWSVPADLATMLLLFWLLSRAPASRVSIRHGLTPLFAVVIEAALLRPPLSLSTWLGMLIMAIGSLWIVFAPLETEPDTTSNFHPEAP